MDFNFSEEQRQLEDTVKRFVDRDYPVERRRGIKDSPGGWSREVWRELADLGVLAINVSEEHGGLGAGPIETMLVMNAFGAGLLVEPYLASAVVATALIRAAADEIRQAELLPAIAAGERIAVLAHEEAGARGETARVETRATKNADGYLLQGRKAVVAHAGAADVLLVSARTSGAPDAAHGISLFLLRKNMPGLTLCDYPTLDGRRAADVRLDHVPLPASARLGAEGRAFGAIERALDLGIAALCAEASGIMKALLDATVEYLKTRRQFGQPIGGFQALRHRAADMLVLYEQAKSMSYLAAMRCTSDNAAERRRAVSAAKVVTGQACRFISQQALQLHGGMGMTDELNVSHWFKRLTAIELAFGDTDSHIERFIEAAGFGSA
jgi:alkylation response protein AidB-like acyl-CoA dehydrogenase